MPESKRKAKPHSAENFIASRDLWWNADFLRLFRKRWNLAKVGSVLDVGCGVGHWGRTLEPFLNKGTVITGIDPEPEWVKKAGKAAPQGRCKFEFRQGSATETGYPSDHFDMVTCQTVLIHVPDVLAALKEMLRVLKPGGLLALAEPDNFSSSGAWSTLRDESTPRETLSDLGIIYLCERGKEILGEGDSSAGSKLAGLLSSLGVMDIQAFISDRALPIYPPYRKPEQRILVRERVERLSPEQDALYKAKYLRYFLAAGGKKREFLAYWKRGKHWEMRAAAQIRAKSFMEPGTAIMHMVSCAKSPRKPKGKRIEP